MQDLSPAGLKIRDFVVGKVSNLGTVLLILTENNMIFKYQFRRFPSSSAQESASVLLQYTLLYQEKVNSPHELKNLNILGLDLLVFSQGNRLKAIQSDIFSY